MGCICCGYGFILYTMHIAQSVSLPIITNTRAAALCGALIGKKRPNFSQVIKWVKIYSWEFTSKPCKASTLRAWATCSKFHHQSHVGLPWADILLRRVHFVNRWSAAIAQNLSESLLLINCFNPNFNSFGAYLLKRIFAVRKTRLHICDKRVIWSAENLCIGMQGKHASPFSMMAYPPR